MPRLVEMQKEYLDLNLRVLAVTDAGAAHSRDFSEEHDLNFSILAEAPKTREAFGVEMVWGSTHYLANPRGKIVAKGLKLAAAVLDRAADTP